MEKTKLIETRKAKGHSQQYIAEKLAMDVSNYNRREKGQVKIDLSEWDKLSQILDVPVENIFESEESNIVIFRDFKDNAVGNNFQGINKVNYSVSEDLIEIQRKYIEKLEKEIEELRRKLDL